MYDSGMSDASNSAEMGKEVRLPGDLDDQLAAFLLDAEGRVDCGVLSAVLAERAAVFAKLAADGKPPAVPEGEHPDVGRVIEQTASLLAATACWRHKADPARVLQRFTARFNFETAKDVEVDAVARQ